VAFIFLIPLMMRLGLPEHAAKRAPFLGIALGLALGLVVYQSNNVKEAVLYFRPHCCSERWAGCSDWRWAHC
jgi:hypothetical protein